MAINLTYTSGNNVSITNSETSLAVDGGSTSLQTLTDSGVYQLFLSGVASMVKADEYRLKVYEKAQSSAAKEVVFSATLTNVQAEVFVTPQLILGVGWDITLQRISASSRNFYWTIRRIS